MFYVWFVYCVVVCQCVIDMVCVTCVCIAVCCNFGVLTVCLSGNMP